MIITCCLCFLLFLSGVHSLVFSLLPLGKSFLRFFLSINFSFLIMWSIPLFEHIDMFILQLGIFWIHFSIGEMDRLDSHGKIPVCPPVYIRKKNQLCTYQVPCAFFIMYPIYSNTLYLSSSIIITLPSQTQLYFPRLLVHRNSRMPFFIFFFFF